MDSAVDAATRLEVIDAMLGNLRAQYVFPEVAEAMEQAIRRRLSNGEYEEIVTGQAFAERLTADLQEVSHDKHLRIMYSPEPHPVQARPEDTPDEPGEFQQFCAIHNFGFERVERLAGNIGYLDLRGFFPPDVAGATAVAAMAFLAHACALIIDLRQNHGGHPAMVALVSSYLFTEPTHLNTMWWRAGDRTEQFWTLAYVPGLRNGTRPVYILTSAETFSGGEEFCYNLKHLKRATLIGETTGGGAHPGGVRPITPHFAIWLPTGRPINPITGTNWEGTGVLPDIAVPREEALTVAYRAALQQVLERAGTMPTRPGKELAEEARQALTRLDTLEPTMC